MNRSTLLNLLVVSLLAAVVCAAWWEKNETMTTITESVPAGRYCSHFSTVDVG